jgi:hypothetical protein
VHLAPSAPRFSHARMAGASPGVSEAEFPHSTSQVQPIPVWAQSRRQTDGRWLLPSRGAGPTRPDLLHEYVASGYCNNLCDHSVLPPFLELPGLAPFVFQALLVVSTRSLHTLRTFPPFWTGMRVAPFHCTNDATSFSCIALSVTLYAPPPNT